MSSITPAPDTTVYVSFIAEVIQPTTEALLGVMADLANKRVAHVYLLLSTPGGSVNNGLTVYNLLKGMPFKLTTHNVGNVNSIGNMIFLAGTKRYACPHTTFMFHGVGFDVTEKTRFEEKSLRERLDSIGADQKRIAAVIAERTQIASEEVEKLFLEAVTRDPNYAKSNGIIHEIKEVEIPAGAPLMQLVFKR